MASNPVNTPRPVADSLAVGLSALCLLHCLALPALVVALPALGMVSHASWLHFALFLVALPVSAWALYRGAQVHGSKGPALLGSIGLGLLAAGVLAHGSGDMETTITITGTVVLALSHGWNMRQ
jgi:MerC mercury resistance protein